MQAQVKCEERGVIFIKGKKHMTTYYIVTNKDFKIVVQNDDYYFDIREADQSTDL